MNIWTNLMRIVTTSRHYPVRNLQKNALVSHTQIPSHKTKSTHPIPPRRTRKPSITPKPTKKTINPTPKHIIIKPQTTHPHKLSIPQQDTRFSAENLNLEDFPLVAIHNLSVIASVAANAQQLPQPPWSRTSRRDGQYGYFSRAS